MTPTILIAVLAVLALARLILWVAPTAIADDKGRAVIRAYLDALLIAGAVALLLMHSVLATFSHPSGATAPHIPHHDPM